MALLDSRKAVNFDRALKMPGMGISENMSGLTGPHCYWDIELFISGGGEKAARELQVPFLGKVPIDPQVVITGDSGDRFIITHPGPPSAKTLEELRLAVKEYMDHR